MSVAAWLLGISAVLCWDPPGRGHYDGTFVPQILPAAVVQSFLPDGLQLAPNPVTGPTEHPVIFVYGEQYHVRPTFGPPYPFDINYLEFIFSVPYVEYDAKEAPKYSYKGPFVFSPRLYLNNSFAVLLGDIYGLAKEMATIRHPEEGKYYTISTEKTNSLLLHVEWNATSEFKPPSAFPNFQNLAAGMASPLIGKRLGFFECCFFDWGLKDASLQAVQGEMEVYQPFVGKMPTEKLDFPSVATSSMGGFRLLTNWTMSMPDLCEHIPHPPPSSPLPTPRSEEPKKKKKKVAILGSGLGAMTTAYYLTNTTTWRDEYEVTVYQMGWRAGGKAASGRSREKGQRIEEHGLHLLMGWYNNVFTLLQDSYRENARPKGAPLATWDEAVKPTREVGLPANIDQAWYWFGMGMTPNVTQLPGPGPVPTAWEMLILVVDWIHKHFPDHLTTKIATVVHNARTVDRFTDANKDEVLQLLQQRQHQGHHALHRPINPEAAIMMAECGLQMGLAIAAGILRYNIINKGFGAVNEYEGVEFIVMNGFPRNLTHPLCPVPRGGYDLVFGFQNGDVQKPDVAAGTAMFGFINMGLNVRGSLFYRMQAGMGETVLGPVYQVLKRRGVKFEFFNKVTGLLSSDKKVVDTIEIDVQATVKGGKEYDPLYVIKGLPVWGDEPDYDQLVEGSAIKQQGIDLESYWTSWTPVHRRKLVKGVDFDEVVLGITQGALPHITQNLMAAQKEWNDMVTKTTTVATQAMQLWTYPTTAELGFETVPQHNGSTTIIPQALVSAYADPFNTWAEMTELLQREAWSPDSVGGRGPKAVEYFCGPMAVDSYPPFTNHTFPALMKKAAQDNAAKWIRDNIHFLWPKSVQNGVESLYAELVAPLDVVGEDRLRWQYIRANVEPTEQYVLSTPGSVKYRKVPWSSGFSNLYLAGDHTHTGIDAGCAEAAVTSGMMAVHGITGGPFSYSCYLDVFNATHPVGCNVAPRQN